MNDEQWFRLHSAYLQSNEWRLRRQAVLMRDAQRGGCQARLQQCTGHAEEVHHLTYSHWRAEPLFDLIAVCSACHQEVTRMDRQNRAPRGRYARSEWSMTKANLPPAQELLAEHEKRVAAERAATREVVS